jgi:hypothetical protein
MGNKTVAQMIPTSSLDQHKISEVTIDNTLHTLFIDHDVGIYWIPVGEVTNLKEAGD